MKKYSFILLTFLSCLVFSCREIEPEENGVCQNVLTATF